MQAQRKQFLVENKEPSSGILDREPAGNRKCCPLFTPIYFVLAIEEH